MGNKKPKKKKNKGKKKSGNGFWGSAWSIVIGLGGLLVTSGFFMYWWTSWSEIDRNANKVIDLMTVADKISPTNDQISGMFHFQRVPKKADFIRAVRVKAHSGADKSFFSEQKDLGALDLEAWNAAIDFFWKNESLLHPRKAKGVAWLEQWRKVAAKYPIKTNPHAMTVEPALALGVIAKSVGSNVPDNVYSRKVTGRFFDELPRELAEAGYPVVDMESPAIRQELEAKSVDVFKPKKYFAPDMEILANPKAVEAYKFDFVDSAVQTSGN